MRSDSLTRAFASFPDVLGTIAMIIIITVVITIMVQIIINITIIITIIFLIVIIINGLAARMM